jgi:hypothetical protein
MMQCEPHAIPLKPKDGLNGAPGDFMMAREIPHLRIEMWGTRQCEPHAIPLKPKDGLNGAPGYPTLAAKSRVKDGAPGRGDDEIARLRKRR